MAHHCITKDGGPWAIQNILSQIKHILTFDRDTISHTYREENQVIYSFASEGWDQCKQEYGPPDLPQGTRALVQVDRHGLPAIRER